MNFYKTSLPCKLAENFLSLLGPEVQPFVSALALFLPTKTLCDSPLLEEILLTKSLLYFMVVAVYTPPGSLLYTPW